tara:strand:- start:382 stop:804 length:423 start_codon:yes stop_codon:yes gene_type:complete
MAYPRDIFSALGRVGTPIGNLIGREISETRNMGQSFADWLQNQAQQSLHYSQLPPAITRFGNELNWMNDRETLKRRMAEALLAGPFAPLLDQWGRTGRDEALLQNLQHNMGYSNVPNSQGYYFTLNPVENVKRELRMFRE